MRNFAREFLAAAEITSRAKNRFAYFLPAQSGISDDKDPKWRGPFRDSFRSNVKKKYNPRHDCCHHYCPSPLRPRENKVKLTEKLTGDQKYFPDRHLVFGRGCVRGKIPAFQERKRVRRSFISLSQLRLSICLNDSHKKVGERVGKNLFLFANNLATQKAIHFEKRSRVRFPDSSH